MIDPKLYRINFLSSGGIWHSILTVSVDMDDKTAELIARDELHNASLATIDWDQIDEVDGHEIYVSGKEI